jgi:hypothetical protein
MESEGRGKEQYKRQNLSEHEAAGKSWIGDGNAISG